MVKKVVGKKPAKKTTKKTGQAKSQGFVGFVKQYKFLIIALVLAGCLLAVIGGTYVSNKMAINTEKQQFENAEVALNQLQAEIIAKLGEPISVNSTNGCGYASTVDGRGDLSCGVGFEIYYPSGMNTLIVFNETMGVLSYGDGLSLNYQKYDETYKFGDSSFSIAGIGKSCGLSLRDTKEDKVPYPGTIIRSSCGGPAKAEHYPVVKG